MKRETKGKKVGTYETLNDVLVNLFRDISGIEQKAVRKLGYPDITMNDLHVIEAIGTGEPKSMSSVAKALSVTVGTLTISVNSLVKKGYVIRQRSSEDRRVVLIFLSARGKDVFEHHARFHQSMIDGIVKELSQEELEALTRALTKLNSWFRGF